VFRRHRWHRASRRPALNSAHAGARDEPSTNGELDYNKSRSMTSSGYPAHSQISPPPTKKPEIPHAAKPASIARYRAGLRLDVAESPPSRDPTSDRESAKPAVGAAVPGAGIVGGVGLPGT
jgi:hypothetical protein